MKVFKIALLFSVFLYADCTTLRCPTSPSRPQVCADVPRFECPTIVSRSQWGAMPPNETTEMRTPVEYIIVHHTATGSCSSVDSCSRILRNIQHGHMFNRNDSFSDIGYSFLVGGDGKVYEGRGWNKRGAHAPGYNDRSIGISFIGNFQENAPPFPQLKAGQELITCGAERGMVRPYYKLLGHRQTRPTECPGDALFNIIRTSPRWVENP